jgi:phage terminase large subunit
MYFKNILYVLFFLFMNDIELLKLLIIENRTRIPKKLLPLWEDKRYKFASGGRGSGKSESFAKILLYRANNTKKKILCTREIQNSIKDSVHALLKRLIEELQYSDYVVTDNSIFHRKNGSEFIFKGLWQQDKKQTIKSIDDIDICWVEEAQTVSTSSLNILDPTIRRKGSEVWFSYNRLLHDDPVFVFNNSIPDDKKININSNYYDNEYVTAELLDQALRSKKQYEDGINEDYPHVWLGEPVQFGDQCIIPYSKVMQAVNRDIESDGGVVVGADIARFGNDSIVFFKRKGLKVVDYREYHHKSVTDTADLLIDFVGNAKDLILIDDTGVGGGVTDYLKKFGYNAIGINFGGSPKNQDKYNNIISEMWFEFKEMIDIVSIPDISRLKTELSSREWKMDIKQKRCVESKADYKKRGFKSPDFADALLLCFYNSSFSDKPVFFKRIM